MKSITFDFDYSKQKEFKFAFFTDLHGDARGCQKEKLINNLQWAYDNTDGIFLGGDIYSCLLPQDKKRFTLAHAIATRDDYKDYIIKYVFEEILKPFAKKIKYLGMGNHEATVLKYHSSNPLTYLEMYLKGEGGKPILGDYQNFIQFKFHHGDNMAVRTYKIWACHGMGAGAKRSRGSLEWDLVYSRFDARLYWMGHNHMAEIDNTGSYTYMNQVGEIKTDPKRGLRTPGWEETVAVRDINSPYDIKYGEERHGLPCAPPQFGLLEIRLAGQGHSLLKDTICLMDV